MLMIRLFNVIILIGTIISLIPGFHRDGVWRLSNGLISLRYFTRLSNLFCAIASLLVLVTLTDHGLPHWVWLMKYCGTVAVTVTFVTVMVFLGPTQGYREQLEGSGFFLHVSGPLLALISFCFLERFQSLNFTQSLLGLLPMVLYGLLYAYKVLLCPEEKRWKDFYGFTKGGKWLLSTIAMLAENILICGLITFLYHL